MEFHACRPSASASFAASPSSVADPALCSAVCRGIANVIRLLAVRAEAASAGAHSGSAVAIADHCVPTPAQQLNLAIASRLDDVRVAVIALIGEFNPLQQFEHLLPIEETHPAVVTLASERARMYPLRPRFPPALLAASHVMRVGRGTHEGDLIAQVKLQNSAYEELTSPIFFRSF